MMKRIFLIAFLSGQVLFAKAQEEDTEDSSWSMSGYVDLYYGFDYNRPTNNTRPSFVNSHNRHNEVNLNLGFLKAGYDNEHIRTNLAFMAGTYSNANLASEPGVLKNILEANAGIKLLKNASLWLDVGIFASHIGFESIVSNDCWTLTRGIASDNTPYYESGAKLTFITRNEKLNVAGLFLNGWQRINRQDGNSKPAGGLQIIYKPSDKIILNYSNFLGMQNSDALGVYRLYHNFHGTFQLNSALGLTLGLDYGIQQQAKDSNNYNNIISPVVIARYQLAEKWALAGRFEYYQDKNGMLIATETPNGFNTKAYSLNIDYGLLHHTLIRLEGKLYDSTDEIFDKQGELSRYDALITTSFAVSF